jgi:hypothetical protein
MKLEQVFEAAQEKVYKGVQVSQGTIMDVGLNTSVRAD